MRLMSFFLTQRQMRDCSKTETRRLGWRHARPGWIVQPIEKGQGLKKGQKVREICPPIEFLWVRFQPLNVIDQDAVIREGFPEMTPAEFIQMFCDHNRCAPNREITVIGFRHFARPRPNDQKTDFYDRAAAIEREAKRVMAELKAKGGDWEIEWSQHPIAREYRRLLKDAWASQSLLKKGHRTRV